MLNPFSVKGKKLEPERACTWLCVHLWWKVKAFDWRHDEPCASRFQTEISRTVAKSKNTCSLLCVHLWRKAKALYWGHELCGTLWNFSTIKTGQNEVQVPTAMGTLWVVW